jgi:hypothetical protein
MVLAPAGKAFIEAAGFGLADAECGLDSGGAEAVEAAA